jgi:trimeric autotransporter adhesin
VALSARNQVTLNLNGNSLVSLTVAQGAVDALVENKQLMCADGGQVLMTAKATDELFRGVVNNAGIIEANTLSNVNGVIRLEGGMVNNSGTIRAEGSAAEDGGKITLRAAQDLTLEATSLIAANGARGGAVSIQAETGPRGYRRLHSCAPNRPTRGASSI